MKILFLANFLAEEEWELWQRTGKTDCPQHILWGITQLQRYGIEVDVLSYDKYKSLQKLGYKLKLGDLDQQLRAFLIHRNYDIIYSAGQTSTIVLAILRCLGLFSRPLVVKLERPFKVNLLNRLLLGIFSRGHARLLCLSDRMRNQLRDDFHIPSQKVPLLDWGPDLPFYDERRQSSDHFEFIMSAGSTGRDFDTLIQAVSTLNYPLRIYCAGNSAPDTTQLPPNVTVQYKHPTEKRALTFDELLMEYEKANFIVIPLLVPPERVDTTTLIGLTSLLEAMAMGKAVVMTKHKQANIDIEKEGIGLWVEPGDVEGWRKAVQYLLDHPEETKAMGLRARHLAEKRYNLELFSAQLAEELKEVFLETGTCRSYIDSTRAT